MPHADIYFLYHERGYTVAELAKLTNKTRSLIRLIVTLDHLK